MSTEPSATLDDFLGSLSFTPDPFQVESLAAIDAGKSVVVTAPTGAGKTVIAEGAVALAIARGARAFYTTPIKALSNQKFHDLVDAWGSENVGLLTGDNVINGDAPVVVMTTEVLRNMIYEGSSALRHLGVVILDEVHYLADRHRGSVWEEVIIHMDRSVPVVCLSATIANPDEFTDWIRSRRGPTDLIIETNRPVPLTSMYMWRDRNHGGTIDMLPVFARSGRPNPTISKIFARSKGRYQRFSTPRRTDVVEHLRGEGLLPAIYFVFSRKGCDATAEQVASAGLGLTSKEERQHIRSIISAHTSHLSPEDLAVLGFERWKSTLERGAAAHHAGMVPAFKETVEDLFVRGLVKVVAATETLALGINMPARTVIIESLSKFNGETHELLMPSDYTQLTGRAGRRGIDTEGTAVVLHSSYVPFGRVSGIAAAGSNPLRSSFAPSYNMTVNLMARYDSDTAHTLLAASFANFANAHRQDALAENLAERRRDLATFRTAAECDRGDIWAFTDAYNPGRTASLRSAAIQPGAVVEIKGRLSVILGRSWGGNRPRLELTDASGKRRTVQSRELPKGTVLVGSLTLHEPVRISDVTYRSEIANRLETFVPTNEPVSVFDIETTDGVGTCPELDTHISWVDRARRADRDVRRLERRISRGPSDDVAAQFDRLRVVLSAKGYTKKWSLTRQGETLRTLYNELDLLLAEALASGVLDGFSPPEFAALASIFTYETRGGGVPEVPQARFAAEPIDEVMEMWSALIEIERSAGVTPSRQPDVGLVDIIHGWASGQGLDEIFEDEDIRAGDFVRSTRQLLDLLRQVRDGYQDHRGIAAKAIHAIDRGIVSSEVAP